MKIIVDKEAGDYLEIKSDGMGNVDFSVRTKTEVSKSIIITAKLNPEILDKLITNLIILKSKVVHEQ